MILTFFASCYFNLFSHDLNNIVSVLPKQPRTQGLISAHPHAPSERRGGVGGEPVLPAIFAGIIVFRPELNCVFVVVTKLNITDTT